MPTLEEGRRKALEGGRWTCWAYRPLPVWFLCLPGNYSIYWTTAVSISDPVVIDTEATGTRCTDLVQRGTSDGSGNPASTTRWVSSRPHSPGQLPTLYCIVPHTPLHLFGGREDHTLYRGCPLCPEGNIGCGGSREARSDPVSSFPSPLPAARATHTEHRDVHIDVGHRALLQLAEELLCQGRRTDISPLLPHPRTPTPRSSVGLTHFCEFCRANEPKLLRSPAGKYDGSSGSPGAWKEEAMRGQTAGSSDPG